MWKSTCTLSSACVNENQTKKCGIPRRLACVCVLINDENNEDEVNDYDDNDDDGDYNASNVFVLKVCVGFKMRPFTTHQYHNKTENLNTKKTVNVVCLRIIIASTTQYIFFYLWKENQQTAISEQKYKKKIIIIKTTQHIILNKFVCFIQHSSSVERRPEKEKNETLKILAYTRTHTTAVILCSADDFVNSWSITHIVHCNAMQCN